jgi:hypothetical protein
MSGLLSQHGSGRRGCAGRFGKEGEQTISKSGAGRSRLDHWNIKRT